MSTYIGRHHHKRTALASIAGNGLPLGLMPTQHLEQGDVAVDVSLTGDRPQLRLVSDHDIVTIDLSRTAVKAILDQAAIVMARSGVELRGLS